MLAKRCKVNINQSSAMFKQGSRTKYWSGYPISVWAQINLICIYVSVKVCAHTYIHTHVIHIFNYWLVGGLIYNIYTHDYTDIDVGLEIWCIFKTLVVSTFSYLLSLAINIWGATIESCYSCLAAMHPSPACAGGLELLRGGRTHRNLAIVGALVMYHAIFAWA